MSKREKSSFKGVPIIGVVILAILGLLGGGFAFGPGEGSGLGNGDGDSIIEENQNGYDESDEEENMFQGTLVAVTVSSNDYFYENEKISLDDLIKEIQDIDEEVLVEIKDEKASFNAYNKLLDKLDVLCIDYVEKQE